MFAYYALQYYGSRKQNSEYFRRTLTRDSEMESTFYPKNETMTELRNKFMKIFDSGQWVLLHLWQGRAQGEQEMAESSVKEQHLEGNKN